MSLWSYLTGPSFADDGSPIKSRAEKLDDQLGRIEADLSRLKTAFELCDRRLDKLTANESSQATHNHWGVIEVVSKGNLADRMVQFMTALSILHHAGSGTVAGVELPEWQIEHAVHPNADQKTVRDSGQWVPVQRLAKMLRDCLVERVVLEGTCRNIDNFLTPEAYRDYFSVDPNIGLQTGSDSLLISIAGNDPLSMSHEDDVLLPVDFYAELVFNTGLKPVFTGQLSPSPYMDALRSRFPDARYLESLGNFADFATILKAKNIVVGVSMVSWLAAWLSNANQIILPLSGMLNPFQNPGQDLVPKQDKRYKLYLFPINYAVPVESYKPVHDALIGRWQPVTADGITASRGNVPRQPRKIADYKPLFDEVYYLRSWHDVRDGVLAGWLTSGYSHFNGPGFAENRRAFDLDHKFYSISYPDAAEAVGCGQYLDLWHYHASVGHAAGNRLRSSG